MHVLRDFILRHILSDSFNAYQAKTLIMNRHKQSKQFPQSDKKPLRRDIEGTGNPDAL